VSKLINYGSDDFFDRATRSAAEASEVILRLAKNGQTPVLSLSIKSAVCVILPHPFLSSLFSDDNLGFLSFCKSRTGKEFNITQDIAVRVLKYVDMQALKEPLCPDVDVRERESTPSLLFLG
jgi:hypothetical protein